MARFTLLPDGQVHIVGKSPPSEILEEIKDRMEPEEGAVVVEAAELEAFLANARLASGG